jgi:hypothetical protein
MPALAAAISTKHRTVLANKESKNVCGAQQEGHMIAGCQAQCSLRQAAQLQQNLNGKNKNEWVA